ncbi:MAG: T9SS type A sorting domain-containing protein [Bacteroidota bacterium]
MKHSQTLFIIICMLSLVTALSAQVDSTAGNGNWNSITTWKSGTIPTGSGTYIIRATDSVYFSSAVTITGKVKTLSGKIGTFDSTQVVFGNGSTYEHAVNGGTIPKATWATGSTLLVTGATANMPNNAAQNFYNITWDCPAQSAGLNLGMSNQTIGGTIRVIKSNSQYLRLTAANITIPGGRKLITINGGIQLDTATAYFTSTGSGSPDDTFSVVTKGDVVSKGAFQIANGSGGSVNWYFEGNVSALEGSFTTNSTATKPDSVFFSGTKKQLFLRGASSSNVRFVVKSGAIVDFDTSSLGGSAAGTFTLQAGGTVISGHPKGLKGNINVTAGTSLSTAANYEYDGVAAQVDTLLPATVKNLTINNTAGFTLLAPVTINGVLALKAGQLDNTIGFTLGAGATISYLGGSLKLPVTGVRAEQGSSVPKEFFVSQNYPNPFNPSTTISFGIPADGSVSVNVYSLLGQKVAELYSGPLNAGVYSMKFDASDLGSGIYFYSVRTGNSVQTKRMMLLK